MLGVLSLGVTAMANEGLLTATPRGEVRGPVFFRHDVGPTPGRLHEPSADTRGNIWTTPIVDWTLWRYATATGELERLQLRELEPDEPWSGHLWPVAYGSEVYLCVPDKDYLLVYDQDTRTIARYAAPARAEHIYGGFASPRRARVYLYTCGKEGQGGAVIEWDPARHQGEAFVCPYTLSGDLYMTFLDDGRGEVWGSTYTGNDLVRFDVKARQWTGHWKCPYPNTTPTPSNEVVDGRLYVADHLNGRIIPFRVADGVWEEPIPVPGYGEWFGYVSGGWYYRGLFYFVHSTWIGGTDSIDGQPHHFLGTLTVFDPRRRAFSRLDIPARSGEEFMCDYLLEVGGELFLLAANRHPPLNAVILRTSRPRP